MAAAQDLMSSPGKILEEEFLKPLGMSQQQLARAIGKPETFVSEIISGKRTITADTAQMLAEALGTTPGFWMRLQTTFDLRTSSTSASTAYAPSHLREAGA
ncbi:MAG: HTH cro/C1-type domain-containing protein [Atopobium sp.]|jgi:antitoxin HigA-1